MEREEEREWGEWEGVGRRGGNGNFYILINFGKKRICLPWEGLTLTEEWVGGEIGEDEGNGRREVRECRSN